MSEATTRLVRDPTLYRVACVAGWMATESEEESRRGLERLEDVLRRCSWAPPRLPGPAGARWPGTPANSGTTEARSKAVDRSRRIASGGDFAEVSRAAQTTGEKYSLENVLKRKA